MTFGITSTIRALEKLFLKTPVVNHHQLVIIGSDDIYVSIGEAKAELEKRSKDTALRDKVLKYLEGDVPEEMLNEARAVMFRNIISPTVELLHGLEIAKQLGLRPLGAEYTADTFSTRNSDKLMLAKLPLLLGKDKNGGLIVQKKKIIDIKANDNKKFHDILTLNNESLYHFHHCLLKNYLLEPIETTDLSNWTKRQGGNAAHYYDKFLALFVYHGILLETFVTNDTESDFADKIVIPAYKKVMSKIGVKPLIVKTCNKVDDDYYWMCYPGDLLK